MMKKVFNTLFAITVLFVSIFYPVVEVEAQGKTLGDLYKEVEKLEKIIEQTKREKQYTQQELARINRELNETYERIEKANEDITNAENLIIGLENKLVEVEIELQDILKQYQISSNNLDYLEYVFGAQDYSEFIQRTAVIETILDYNQKVINDTENLLIETNKQKENLEKTIEYLETQKTNLTRRMYDYRVKEESLDEVIIDAADELELTKISLDYYRNLGCQLNEYLNDCIGKNIPFDTGFIKPITVGYITSSFGTRRHPVTGKPQSFHNAVDIGTNGVSANIYPAANGRVELIVWNNAYSSSDKKTCGQNLIYIHHNINGKAYTTFYYHVDQVFVQQGQVVSRDTVIGKVGGDPSKDRCSTGYHLHFGVASGYYPTSGQTLNSMVINPRSVVNFPKDNWVYWYSR